MHRLCRITFAHLALLALLLPALVLAAGTPEELILGKWRHVSLRRIMDGKELPLRAGDGKAFSEFRPGGKWELAGSTSQSGGTYKWLDAERIEMTILHSSLPAQIGWVSIKKIHVTADSLELITVDTREAVDKHFGPLKGGARRAEETVVISVFKRDNGN